MSIKISDIREYQQRVSGLKRNNQFTGRNFKALGIELRDKFGLTDREAIDILNGHDDAILKILEKQEVEG
jgi:hypothetical protein